MNELKVELERVASTIRVTPTPRPAETPLTPIPHEESPRKVYYKSNGTISTYSDTK